MPAAPALAVPVGLDVVRSPATFDPASSPASAPWLSPGPVLTGHVLGSLSQSMVSLVVVVAVSIGVGVRPTAGVAGWLGAAGILGLATLALSWLSVALGLVSKSVETASNLPMVLTLLPFLGSGFVPTDSMPAGLRWFAEYQPFTPVIETVRGRLLGTPIGHNALLAVAWCVVIGLASYLWAKRLFIRRTAR
jgi:ABC-2 type transport system permease protein